MSRCSHAPGAAIALLAGVVVSACGGAKARPAATRDTTTRPAVHRPGGATPAQQVRLAVLPADSDRYPRLAAALSDALVAAKVAGVDDVLVTKASLEVVQISIECIDPSAECYAAAGRSLEVNRVLFARLHGEARKQAVSATVTLFDVDSGAEVRSASRTWDSEDVALSDVGGLVGIVTGAP